jgi:hypothetical protein
MVKEPTKTIVAIAIFTLAEASPIRTLIIAGIHAGNVALSNGSVYDYVIWALALAFGYLGGWLIFKKWNARFWVKAATAAGIVLLSFPLFGMIGLTLIQRPY